MKKILVIQTGGTIGMVKGPKGFEPSDRNYLEDIPELSSIANIESIFLGNKDSTNMTTEDRADIAKAIFFNYNKYDGFVVAHGTDTMTSTSAALTYMLQEIGKPVVMTGSQIPLSEGVTTDGKKNLYNAVKLATKDISGIVIAFGDHILDGLYAIKKNENAYNAFYSYKKPPIGRIGIDIVLENERKRTTNYPKLFTQFETGIETYIQTSGSTSKVLENYAKDDSVKGVIIGGYGVGNIQSKFIPQIVELVKNKKPVMIATTCIEGNAELDLYETGNAALKAGAVSAENLTLEAAAQKMMYTLGRRKVDEEEWNKRYQFM